MRTRADYDRAVEIVSKVVNAFDPYGLIAGGAPKDEFESEIAEIVRRIPSMQSTEDAALVASETFQRFFKAEDFPITSCRALGQKLYVALSGAGLLEQQKQEHE